MRLLVLLLAFLAACSRSVPEVRIPVTETQAREAGAKFSELIPRCEPRELGELTDMDTLLARTMDAMKQLGSDATDEVRNVLTGELLWRRLCDGWRGGGARFKVLRVGEVDQQWRPLIRVLLDDGSLNYLELELVSLNGSVRIVDMLVFNGVRVSESMAEAIGAILGTGEEAAREGLKRFARCTDPADTQCKIDAIEALPDEVRDRKWMLLGMLGLLPADDPRYLPTIERFERLYPNDVALALVSVDAHIMRKEYDKARAAIDVIEGRTHDPYLEVMRAYIAIIEGDLPAGRKQAERAIAAEPDLRDAYEVRFIACVNQREHTCSVEAAKTLSERFDKNLSLSEINEYDGGKELLASDAWKAWKK